MQQVGASSRPCVSGAMWGLSGRGGVKAPPTLPCSRTSSTSAGLVENLPICDAIRRTRAGADE